MMTPEDKQRGIEEATARLNDQAEAHARRPKFTDRFRAEKLAKWYNRHKKVIEASKAIEGDHWLCPARCRFIQEQTGAKARLIIQVLTCCEPEKKDVENETETPES